jgi:hypothetical protein
MEDFKNLYKYLKKSDSKKILFLTTSNRWEGNKELPKPSMIANELSIKLGSNKIQLIYESKLNTFSYEGAMYHQKWQYLRIERCNVER